MNVQANVGIVKMKAPTFVLNPNDYIWWMTKGDRNVDAVMTLKVIIIVLRILPEAKAFSWVNEIDLLICNLGRSFNTAFDSSLGNIL